MEKRLSVGMAIIPILATSLGGLLEETGAFQVLTRKMLEKVKTTGSLISMTIVSTFLAFLVPLINILYGYTGWTITKKSYSK
ncbi:Na+/H+ antiporter NhaC family protein [Sporosarcina sp. G11-34]|uniref:Na+/H+ antiporter NhaC family protein n=1 Tax=Sporosarcina sp. G11-34 TaxID=2849605 RepID=UPI0022A9A122|nr:Na+/H+ antiporter NhaC family protein [Sporosarcina sp. G11-34]